MPSHPQGRLCVSNILGSLRALGLPLSAMAPVPPCWPPEHGGSSTLLLAVLLGKRQHFHGLRSSPRCFVAPPPSTPAGFLRLLDLSCVLLRVPLKRWDVSGLSLMSLAPLAWPALLGRLSRAAASARTFTSPSSRGISSAAKLRPSSPSPRPGALCSPPHLGDLSSPSARAAPGLLSRLAPLGPLP